MFTNSTLFSNKSCEYRFWLVLLFGILLCHSALSAMPGVSTNPTPVERFIKFVTDTPPIDNAVCVLDHRLSTGAYGRSIFQFRYRQSSFLYQWPANPVLPPQSIRFLYKPASFFARPLTTLTNLDAPISFQQKAVGVWEDDYWFIEPYRGRPSNLNLYHYITNDWSNTLAGYSEFMSTFTLFTSFGIPAIGPGSVVVGKDAPLEIIYDSTTRIPVSLQLKDGVPVLASFRFPIGSKGRLKNLSIIYKYDTNIAPLGIPSQWIMPEAPTTGRLEVLILGDSNKPLPRNVFMPDSVFTNKTLSRVVRTNYHDYIIQKDGKMLQIDDPKLAMAVLEARQPKNRKYYFMLAGLFTLLLVPGLLTLAKKRSVDKNADNETKKSNP
jgi:hypothetical protein